MAYEPIAYTYEADTHCPDCAKDRFGEVYSYGSGDYIQYFATFEEGLRELGFGPYGPFIADKVLLNGKWVECTDNEGNSVGAQFECDGEDFLVCGTCGYVICEPEPDLEPEPYERFYCSICDEERYEDDNFCNGSNCATFPLNEDGSCPSCVACMIQGVYCHEKGCKLQGTSPTPPTPR